MIKKAVVEIGKTPSAISGKPSDKIDIKEKEVFCNGEHIVSTKIAKVAMEKLLKKEK